MKTILTFLGIWCLMTMFSIYGQSVPALPSIEKVFSDVKANQYVYKALKEDYHIANPKSCTFKMGLPNGEGGYNEAYWSTYQSDYALSVNYKWPDDRAKVYFTVITPKSTEGVSYELPLLVEYSRIENDIITNNWSYYWWMFKAPMKTIGKVKQKELKDTLISTLGKLEYHFIPEKNYDYPEQLEKFVAIESITESPKADVTESDSYTEWMTRSYIIKGDYIVTKEDSDNQLGYDGVAEHYEDAEFELFVMFERDKSIGNQKETDWRFYEIKQYNSNLINKGTLVQDTNFYATWQRYGFNKIYQHEKTKVDRDYFTVISIQKFERQVSQVLEDVFLDKPGAEENLSKLCVDEMVTNGWLAAIDEMKRKMVKFEGVDLYTQDIQRYASGDDEHGDISIRLLYSRTSWKDDKALKKTYKDAGMASDILASGGWLQKSSIGGMYDLVAKDNQLKMASYPPVENGIKF